MLIICSSADGDQKKNYVMKKTVLIIGAAAGALSVCFSFYILSLDTGSWEYRGIK